MSLEQDAQRGEAALGATRAGAPSAERFRLAGLRFDVSTLIWTGAAVALLALIVLPVTRLLWAAFDSPEGPTLANLSVFGAAAYRQALQNSFMIAAAVGVLSVLIAVPLAWLVARTDLPGASHFRIAVFASFVTPPFLGALAWALLAGPNAGLLNRIFVALTGAERGPLNIFSIPGVTFAIALYTFPFTFVLVSNVLEAMPSELEEAAGILGAGPFRTTLTVTLPLALPSILAGFVLAFLEALATFAAPALLAIPARTHVATTQIWALFLEFPPNTGWAAALALPLLLTTAVLLWVQRRMLGRRGYAVLTGKGGQRRRVHLGAWRYAGLLFALAVVCCSIFLPYLILVQAAFARNWGLGFRLDNVTLEHVAFVFEYDIAKLALRNTFALAAATATLAAVLAATLAYVTSRRLVRGHHVLGFLATLPFVIPGIVLAVGIFAAYTRPPFALYGTFWIMLIAYLTRFLPLAFTSASATMHSVHVELEEAARILGATRLRVLGDVILPLIKAGVISGWFLVFMPSLAEISSSVLLYVPSTQVISLTMLSLYEEGKYEVVAVLGLILLVTTLGLVTLSYRLFGRSVIRLQQ
ncbi:MAG: iron ABC transporter permease [Chloroflexi bacterium]|nr:iron ABC transporter permease [Chloroflexota bacterium]